jgi:potassium/hydrogen antiporter
MNEGLLIFLAGGLMAGALGASLVATRFRLPALTLFLGVGILAGSGVTGWLRLTNYDLARVIGTTALALILFEGGLGAGWPELRRVLRPAAGLAVVGTFLTAMLAGIAATLLFGLPLLQGLLLGAILSSTDSAAVFSVLRGSSLKRNVQRTLEGEAGLNDPVAVLLVLGLISMIKNTDYTVFDGLILFVRELGVGLACGVAVGWLATKAVGGARFATAGLYPVFSLATAALAYGSADMLHGSGFLAVYLAGILLAGAAMPVRQTVFAFHDGLAWVSQITVFVTLGLLVSPGDLLAVAPLATLLAAFLMFGARPLAVAAATAGTRFSPDERVVLAWAGLRGAVPIVLATFPVIAHVSGSSRFFDIIFFVVLFSALVQGTTFQGLARFLRVTGSQPALPRPLTDSGAIRGNGVEVVEHVVGAGEAIVGRRVSDLQLSHDAVLAIIMRGEEAIPPRGGTRVQAGDHLHLVVRNEAAPALAADTARWRQPPELGARAFALSGWS